MREVGEGKELKRNIGLVHICNPPSAAHTVPGPQDCLDLRGLNELVQGDRRNHEEKLKEVIEKVKDYVSGEVKVIFHVDGNIYKNEDSMLSFQSNLE